METRTRTEFDNTEPVDVTIKRSTFNSSTQKWNAPYTKYSGSYTAETNSRSMTDVVTPDFKKRSARGEVINNPCTRQIVNEYENHSTFSFDYLLRYKSNPSLIAAATRDESLLLPGTYPTYGLSTGHSAYLAAPSLDDEDVQDLKEVAITRAYANISTADALALVTALEMGKTLTSLGSIFKRITKLYKYIIRKNKMTKFVSNAHSARKLAKLYADLWMEARYSLRPLYYDIMGISKALDRPLEKAMDRRTFRGKQIYSDSVEEIYTAPLSDSGHTGSYFIITRKSDVKYVARAGCLCKVSAETRANSLGLYEIPASLWEVVPLSFVFDWFWNIADYISMWTPRLGANVLASWVTVEKTVTQSVMCSPPTNGQPTIYSSYTSEGAGFNWQAGIKVKSTIDIERTVNVSRPVIPHWNVNLNPAKLIDLGIILSNFYKSDASMRRLRL